MYKLYNTQQNITSDLFNFFYSVCPNISKPNAKNAPIVTAKYQTLAYYGIEREELETFVQRNGLTGIDRIVPIGETTAFSLTWDGRDLIQAMSRVVSIL